MTTEHEKEENSGKQKLKSYTEPHQEWDEDSANTEKVVSVSSQITRYVQGIPEALRDPRETYISY